MDKDMIVTKIAELRKNIAFLKEEIAKTDECIEKLVFLLEEEGQKSCTNRENRASDYQAMSKQEIFDLVKKELQEFGEKEGRESIDILKKIITCIDEESHDGGKMPSEVYDILVSYRCGEILNLFDDYYFSCDDGCRSEKDDAYISRILGSWAYIYYSVTKTKVYLRFAIFHLTEAANYGDEIAINNLYFAVQNREEKLYWLRKGASMGSNMMKYRLEKYYATGQMV